MGRFKAGIVSVIGLALLVLSIPVVAQESAQQQKPATQKTAPKETYSPWKEVADGIWKAHISRYPSPEGQPQNPEFAVVRLGTARYEEFKKNRKDFLNDYKIFRKKVRTQNTFEEVAPQVEASGEVYWYVVCSHWPGSSAACVAYSGWSPPKTGK